MRLAAHEAADSNCSVKRLRETPNSMPHLIEENVREKRRREMRGKHKLNMSEFLSHAAWLDTSWKSKR